MTRRVHLARQERSPTRLMRPVALPTRSRHVLPDLLLLRALLPVTQGVGVPAVQVHGLNAMAHAKPTPIPSVMLGKDTLPERLPPTQSALPVVPASSARDMTPVAASIIACPSARQGLDLQLETTKWMPLVLHARRVCSRRRRIRRPVPSGQ